MRAAASLAASWHLQAYTPPCCPPSAHQFPTGQDQTLPVTPQRPDQTGSSQQHFEVPSVGLSPPHVPSSWVPTLADRGALCGIEPTQPDPGRAALCQRHRRQARLRGKSLVGALGSQGEGCRKGPGTALPFVPPRRRWRCLCRPERKRRLWFSTTTMSPTLVLLLSWRGRCRCGIGGQRPCGTGVQAH